MQVESKDCDLCQAGGMPLEMQYLINPNKQKQSTEKLMINLRRGPMLRLSLGGAKPAGK